MTALARALRAAPTSIALPYRKGEDVGIPFSTRIKQHIRSKGENKIKSVKNSAGNRETKYSRKRKTFAKTRCRITILFCTCKAKGHEGMNDLHRQR